MPIIQVIPINLTSVTSRLPVAEVPCGDCTKCCEILSPYLTPAEVASGKYPISLLNPDELHRLKEPEVGPTVVVYRRLGGGCSLLVGGRCSVYDDRPLACRQFDCRKNHHPKITPQC